MADDLCFAGISIYIPSIQLWPGVASGRKFSVIILRIMPKQSAPCKPSVAAAGGFFPAGQIVTALPLDLWDGAVLTMTD